MVQRFLQAGRRRMRLGVVAITVAMATSGLAALSAAPGAHATSLSIRVQGNALVDGTGSPVRLLGVNRSGTEYACSQGWGIFDGPSDAASIAAIASWHTNAVRVPLNEDCWLGINGVNPSYGGANYQSAIGAYVSALHNAGLVAILDLHWNAPGATLASGQQVMTDADHSPAFWSSVAAYFKSDPAVAFDLYNEPHDISWPCWRDGCTTSGGWQAAGMQSLVNAVRATGATQPVMLGGLGWSSDLSSWLTYRPTDPANQVVASFHVYNFSGCSTSSCWDSQVAPVAASVPVVTGEIGENDCASSFIAAYMAWADAHGVSYLGWTWDTWNCSSGLALITAYDGTPTAFGVGFRDHLAALAAITGGAFRPLPPTRVLDTRSGPGPVGALGPGATLDLQMTGAGGIPATGVSAVVFNVTAVGSSAPGYLTVYPTGATRPTSADLNYGTGEVVPNLVEVAVGTGGKVSLYNGSSGSTHYVVDVAGWVTTRDAAAGADGRYNPLTPARVLDTRAASPVNSTGTPLHASADLSLVVTGKGGVPATGVSAVVLNVAVTNPNGSGWVTVYPGGGAAPLAANVNFNAAQTVSNRVVVAVGAGGAVNFHLGGSASAADVIADVGGWFSDATSAAGGSLFAGLTPNRITDTRPSSQVGPKNTPLAAGQTMTVAVAGTPGVPAMGGTGAPKAVVLNVAVTNTTAPSYITVFPSGEAQPLAADLNWAPGATRSNLVVAKVGADGAVKIYNNAGNADVIVDVLGWYS